MLKGDLSRTSVSFSLLVVEEVSFSLLVVEEVSFSLLVSIVPLPLGASTEATVTGEGGSVPCVTVDALDELIFAVPIDLS